MLRIGGAAVVFYALSTVSSSILQALDKMKKPVVHSAISLAVHLVLVSVLIYFTDMGAYALVIGYMTFPVIVGILNMIEIGRKIGYRQEWDRTFGLSTACAVFMGLCTLGVYKLVYSVIQNNMSAVIAALVVAMITYFGPMIALKNVERP